MDVKLEAVVKVTILFLLWSGKIIFWSGKSQGILKWIFCANHGFLSRIVNHGVCREGLIDAVL